MYRRWLSFTTCLWYKCQGAQNVLLGRQELRCQYGDEDKNDGTLALCSGRIRCWWWEWKYMCMLFRPVWRLPLQGGHVHAWGDKYTHTHSLWWENIVSESTSYICYTYSIYTLYHHEILTDPGVGPALEYSSLPSIVNLSCSVRQVINTNNTMKVIIWKFANER